MNGTKVTKAYIFKEKWMVLDDSNNEFPIDKNDFTTIVAKKKLVFDCVFNAIHGHPGEDGTLLAYFDLINLKHTSAPYYQMALTFNKRDSLSVVKHYGIKTAAAVYIDKGQSIQIDAILKKVGLPCFVKPNQAGSSYGVSKVTKPEDLEKAIADAFVHDNQVLVESFLDGREVTCGVHNFEDKLIAMPITEIITDNDFFDFDAKYKGESQEITPANLSSNETSLIQEAAKKIYQLLGMNGVGR